MVIKGGDKCLLLMFVEDVDLFGYEYHRNGKCAVGVQWTLKRGVNSWVTTAHRGATNVQKGW